VIDLLHKPDGPRSPTTDKEIAAEATYRR